jgi:hypothetical protein
MDKRQNHFFLKFDTLSGKTTKTLEIIPLLETIQKMSLKIIFTRITDKIVKRGILKGGYTSVFPGFVTLKCLFLQKLSAQANKVTSS